MLRATTYCLLLARYCAPRAAARGGMGRYGEMWGGMALAARPELLRAESVEVLLHALRQVREQPRQVLALGDHGVATPEQLRA